MGDIGSHGYGFAANSGDGNTFGNESNNSTHVELNGRPASEHGAPAIQANGTTIHQVFPVVAHPNPSPASKSPACLQREAHAHAEATRNASEERDEIVAIAHDDVPREYQLHTGSHPKTPTSSAEREQPQDAFVGPEGTGPERRNTGSRIIDRFRTFKRRLTHHSQEAVRNVDDVRESGWVLCGMPILKHINKRTHRSAPQPPSESGHVHA